MARTIRRLIYSRALLGATLIALISSIFTALYAYQQPLVRTQERVLYEYTSRGAFNYNVTLHPNVLYENDTLVNPERAFLKLVDKVVIGITYSFTSQPPTTNITNALGVEVIVSHPQVWSKKISSSRVESRGREVKHELVLDIQSIISFAKNVSQALDLPSSKYTITVQCVASTLFTVAGLNKATNFPFSFQITADLAGRVIDFSQREFNSTGSQRYTEVYEATLSLGPLNFSTALFRQISLALLVLTATTASTLVGANAIRHYKGRSGGSVALKYTKKYKSIIINSSEVVGSTPSRTIRVESLGQLVGVAESLAKPIVHLKAGNRHAFYLFDGDTAYVHEC